MKKKVKRILLIVLAVVIIIIGIFGVMVYKEIQTRNRVSAALEKVVAGDLKPQDIDYKSLGKYGDFTRDISNAFVKYKTDSDEVINAYNKFNPSDIFSEKYMMNPVGGKKYVQDIVDTNLKYEKSVDQDTELLNNSVDKSPFSSKDKDQLRELVNKLDENTIKDAKATITSVNTFYSKVESIYDFLDSIKGRYTYKDNTIVFDSQQDMDKYDELIKELKTSENALK
ncbi:hypothetical protein [Clostridium sp. 'White wine YQ']|uniref:hypothetical protein n=1 Tax=Clostridium sp. 'White wine YQ' TaxID=3027474 RepID=UPI0023651076|nr:hypothetical protein [Clostridium sp. 'White wine YQ']MDD7793077.1 hypothetical protein [Clostridium sp. 'White wine YQ']